MLRAAHRFRLVLRRSVTAQALMLFAALAFVQVALIARSVASQRDGAHIIDINGSQRTRTQRIAYLALVAHDAPGTPGWRQELHASVDSLLTVRRELLARRDLMPNTVVDSAGLTPLGRAIFRYAGAARRLKRAPADGTAYAYIASNRLALLSAIDAAATARTALIERRTTQLLDGLLVGLVATFGAMALVWKRVIEPAERRAAKLLARLNESEAQLSSLFEENPDAIAIYDTEGRFLRGNRAHHALLGDPVDTSGARLREHVAPAQREEVAAAFARALGGASVAFDTLFQSVHDESSDVHATLFPNVVDGRTVGVIGVAKDTRTLREVEAAYAAQSNRMTALYRAAAYRNGSWKRQVGETLSIAAEGLGYDWGTAVEIVDGVARSVVVVGDAGFKEGAGPVLPAALMTRARFARDVWSIDDVTNSLLRDQPALTALPWATLVGASIEIGDARFGSVVFGAKRVRTQPLPSSDRDFVRMATALVAASIQRGQQEEKLDTLAFFDALTGLPNRVLLADRMTQFLAAATRRNLQFAVHCLDLDRFKAINDSFGHATGDEVLRIVAHRMTSCVREEDTVARLGGDEFVIVQALDPNGYGATPLADRILTALAKPFDVDGTAHAIGVSIGVSLFPQDGRDATTLLRAADAALLRAKYAGRNRCEFAA